MNEDDQMFWKEYEKEKTNFTRHVHRENEAWRRIPSFLEHHVEPIQSR